MVGSQRVFSILDESAAAIGGWTALQSIKCVHLEPEGQDWEPWQAHDIGGTVDVSTFRVTTDLDLAAGASRVENGSRGGLSLAASGRVHRDHRR
jgi:hypothetical protein